MGNFPGKRQEHNPLELGQEWSGKVAILARRRVRAKYCGVRSLPGNSTPPSPTVRTLPPANFLVCFVCVTALSRARGQTADRLSGSSRQWPCLQSQSCPCAPSQEGLGRALTCELTLFPFCVWGRGLQKEPPRSCAATSGGARRPASPWRCGVGSRARAAGSPRTGAPTATALTGRACRPPHVVPTLLCPLVTEPGVGQEKLQLGFQHRRLGSSVFLPPSSPGPPVPGPPSCYCSRLLFSPRYSGGAGAVYPSCMFPASRLPAPTYSPLQRRQTGKCGSKTLSISDHC